MLELKILFLLGIANGAPIIAMKLFGDSLAMPLDRGYQLYGQPLFGPSKTVRGILAALLLTGLCSGLMGLGFLMGIVIATLAMCGDLLSSFIKRRLGRPSSSRFLGLDQIPEALLPLLYCKQVYGLDWGMVFLVVAGFIVVELLLSRVLFALHVRKRPY